MYELIDQWKQYSVQWNKWKKERTAQGAARVVVAQLRNEEPLPHLQHLEAYAAA